MLIGDSFGDQEGLKSVSAMLNKEWANSDIRVHFVSDYATGTAFREWLKSQGETEENIGRHASIHDTSELMAVDTNLIRMEKRAKSTEALPSGVTGDPTRASIRYGMKGLELKIEAAVAQTKKLMTSSRK
jgi:creatinine amidohydrolase/Fe(II)-dependent formamide hydrolase-like protein